MSTHRGKRWLIAAVAAVASVLTVETALATEAIIFGPQQYMRTAGSPDQFTETITLPPTLTDPFRLHVQNGTPDGRHQILGATIRLNGTVVASTDDFVTRSRGRSGVDVRPVAAFDRSVALRTRNTLQVSLTGPRGSFIIVTLFGTIPPPRLTDLDPQTLRISEGSAGTLTATLSAPQPAPITIRVESEHPDVAAVPAQVTVPAGDVEVAVPVTAGVRGTARITARLYESQVHSTVIVTRARPTLTSLLPATLQLALGAAGRLTVTISAAQKTQTYVTLTSSNASLVSLPHGDRVTVPMGHTTASFRVVGVGRGTATITAALNGTTAESQVTVGTAPPAVVSLLPPVLPLTEGSTGTLTVTLNASQPTDTEVVLSTSDASIVGLPGDSLTIPAGQPSASVSVTGLTRGTATVTASLHGTSATAAIEVQPPAPTVAALSCPAALTEGATALCTVTLNATQLVDTVVPLASSNPGLVTVPERVTVPANTLTAQFSVTAGTSPGAATLTAGPVTGTSQSAAIQVLPPPPMIGSLAPGSASLFVGATVTLTLTLNAAQLEDTEIPLASSPSGILTVPETLTVPAGSLTGEVTVTGLNAGTATLTAGPLHGTQAQSVLTVNQLPPTVTALAPSTLSLPKGKAGTLTVTIAPTQPEATVVPLSSSDPSVEVPPSITVPAGAGTAEFPVIARSEGSATITAGALNGTTQTATITVTPAELVTLTITPPSPTIAKGQTQQFTATGTYTDATTQDLTGTASWTSSDPTIASISPGGLAAGHAVGVTTLTATVGAISDTATLTVGPPILASLALSPATPTLLVGQTLQLSAVGTLTDGTTQDVTAQVTWASGNPAVATITSPGGLATAIASGTTTITATSADDVTASTSLTVTLPPPALTGFNPSSGKVGTAVTLTGTNFAAVAAVRFNGVSAPGFTVNSPMSITVAVPPGATTGPIAVTTGGGTATSTGAFIVLPTQDFSLLVEPTTVTAIAGTSVALKVSTVTTGGYTGLTQLSLGALPAGVTATFSTPALGPNASGLLTLTTSGSTPSPATIQVVGATTLAGAPVTRTATATLTNQPVGQTVLAGQVRDENDQPVTGVTIKLGGSSPTTLGLTDAAGNFLVPVAVLGSQVFLIDGSTASTPSASYATIPVTVTVQSGLVNTLGFVPHLHFQKTTGLVNIANSSVQRGVTDPSLPGYQMTIPAGVTITGWDGQPNTQVSIRKVPLDRNPLPPFPADRVVGSLFMDYFGKQGGGTPSAPVPITFPNDLGLPPGTQVELWYYDEAPDGSRPNAWAQYGTGTVSADGSQVVPNTNPSTGKPYGQPRFCCGAAYYAMLKAQQEAVNNQRGGDNLPAGGTSPQNGEPVDLASGLFVLTKTDLVLPGRLPITITRTYRPRGAAAGPFGPGTSHPYHVLLLVESNLRTLLLPGGSRLAFPKQADGTFRNLTDPSMRGAVLSETNGLASLRWKDGATWSFGAPVNATAFLVGIQDRTGNRLLLTRSGSAQNLTSILDSTDRGLTFTYDGSNRITAITDPLGRTVSYTYDGSGNLTTVTDPAGGITQYTYDGNGWMLTITDPRGITFLTNAYDANGRVIRQTQADGGVWTFAYTTAGGTITQTVVTDPRGNATTYRFNGQGYPLSVTDALGQTTTYTRDASTNQLLVTTDPLGRVTRFTYDGNGNVLTITDPLNNTRTFTYDPTFNKVTSITDPLGNLTTIEYDTQGNLLAITDPVQNTQPAGSRLKTTLTYNSFGQPLTTTDPLGSTTTFTYDDVGDLATVSDPLGNTTQRSYDVVSRLVTQTDPLGNTTRFSYDSLNRLVTIVDALNGGTTFGYDPNGNLLTVTDARGNSITHQYDSMDCLSQRVDPLGKAETFNYDGNGNLVSTTDRKNQTTSFTYDPLNRRTQATYADGAVAAFQYDAGGRLLQADDTTDPHRPIALQYDALDRLLSETTTLGTVSYAYDAIGRRTQMLVSGQTPVTYAYDANSRLTGLTQNGQGVVLGYDPVNRRTSLVLPNGVSTEYQYDVASRVTALVYRNALGTLGDLQYTYDAAGNRAAVGGAFARSLLPDTVPTASYDSANRQLTFGSNSMTFDDNGNLASLTTGGQTGTYTWDARNRLTAIGGASLAASFAYDVLDRRAAKTINGQDTSFQYDGLDATLENGATGPVSYLRSLSIDEALTRTDANGNVAFLADALGSTVALTDATGATPTSYTYAPFGQTSVSGLPSLNPFQFTGRENDDTGLYYYRARYYDPIGSRFISEDPIGPAGGDINVYSYVLGSPLSWIDPLGLRLCAISLLGLGSTYLDDSVAPLVEDFIRRNNETGISTIFTEAFRTTSYQQSLTDNPNATTPAGAGRSLHEAGFAVDISWARLSPDARQTVVRNAREAGLKWGGRLRKPDPVHFYKEVPGGVKNRPQYIQAAQSQCQKGNIPPCP